MPETLASVLVLDWLEPPMRPLVEKATEPQRLAATLWGEARSEPVQGIIAIGNVIRNRTAKPGWWGKDWSSVCLAKDQFSCWTPKGGEGNYKRLFALMELFAAGTPIEEPSARECIGIAHLLIGQYLRDNVRGSTHYHLAIMQPRPKWALGHDPLVQVGRHTFYRDIA